MEFKLTSVVYNNIIVSVSYSLGLYVNQNNQPYLSLKLELNGSTLYSYSYRNLDHNNLVRINNSLKHLDWSVLDEKSVDDMLEIITDEINDAINYYAPLKTDTGTVGELICELWMIPSIIKANQKCSKKF